MPTRNVVITQHQSEMIESLVESGQYQNASEVLREGLRLIEQRNAERDARVAAFNAAVDLGFADIAAGRYTDVEYDDVADFVAGLARRGVAEIRAKQ